MPENDEVPFFVAQELIPGYWGDREGTYGLPKGYFVAEESPAAFEAYEAGFPMKMTRWACYMQHWTSLRNSSSGALP